MRGLRVVGSPVGSAEFVAAFLAARLGNVSFSRLVIVMTGTYVPLIFRASSNFSILRGYVRLLVGGSNSSSFFGQKICRFCQFLLDLGPIYPCKVRF